MKNILILFFFQIGLFALSQVGINTISPTGIFQIDAANDNSSTPNQDMLNNDFFIDHLGNVGIGNINPENKLYIETKIFGNGFRLADGSQGNGKILKSLNSDGDMAWENRKTTKIILPDGSGFSGPINSELNYLSRKVTLEPGKWIIKTNLLLYAGSGSGSLDDGFFARFSWAELNNGNYEISNDATFGNVFGGAFVMRFALAKGNTIIENNSSIAKTYYLVNRYPIFFGSYNQNNTWDTLGGSIWGETTIIAFSAD